MSNPSKDLKVRYQQDLMLWRTPLLRSGLLTLIALYILSPIIWETFPVTKFLSDVGLTMTTLNYAGVFAVGAIGLNLLTGYTGQVSLGHSVFVGAGAYFTAYAGTTWDLPFLIWLPCSLLVGFLIGFIVGPLALRLRGNYLVVVTLGLVFLGDHIFRNWKSVTGGSTGVSVTGASLKIGSIDFRNLEIFGHEFEKSQSFFWLISL